MIKRPGKAPRSCPACGGRRIHLVRGEYATGVHNRTIVIPDLERDECPDCGEILFSPQAMRQIEAYRKRLVRRQKLGPVPE